MPKCSDRWRALSYTQRMCSSLSVSNSSPERSCCHCMRCAYSMQCAGDLCTASVPISTWRTMKRDHQPCICPGSHQNPPLKVLHTAGCTFSQKKSLSVFCFEYSCQACDIGGGGLPGSLCEGAQRELGLRREQPERAFKAGGDPR